MINVGLTLGDPSGIGPELVEIALQKPLPSDCKLVIFGDSVLRLPSKLGNVQLRAVTDGAVRPGQPDATSGAAQVAYLEAALAEAAQLDALVTAPIHKASATAAGFAYPGHTEMLAARLGATGATMFFVGPRMKVALVTTHLALRDVPRALSADAVAATIRRVVDALRRDFAVERPRVAVAALNPHAGESGLFGDEERRILAPAIDAARSDGSATIDGPVVADAVFRAHLDGKFDAVVALYHDQALIPVKTVDFEESVNMTLGLPIVRTSPDHGVAHDIAGKGVARATSFIAALDLAIRVARTRQTTR
jgi:4-hydroxythreonine-4-phosphate dehydrogenase